MTNIETPIFEREPTPSKIAIIFQGQGEGGLNTNVVREFYDIPVARKVFDRADKALGFNLSEKMLEGLGERYQQVASVVTSLAIYETAKAMKSSVFERVSLIAGSSLGQYTALIAAGVIPFEPGLRILEERERVTRETHSANPGVMASIIGLKEDIVYRIAEKTRSFIANDNSPALKLIAGKEEDVDRALKIAARLKGRVKKLDLAYASHSPLMELTEEPFVQVLEPVKFNNPQIPVVLNETGEEETSGEKIKRLLPKQLIQTVRLRESMQNMAQKGVRIIVEIGPGRSTLAGLGPRNNENLTGVCINSISSIEKLAA